MPWGWGRLGRLWGDPLALAFGWGRLPWQLVLIWQKCHLRTVVVVILLLLLLLLLLVVFVVVVVPLLLLLLALLRFLLLLLLLRLLCTHKAADGLQRRWRLGPLGLLNRLRYRRLSLLPGARGPAILLVAIKVDHNSRGLDCRWEPSGDAADDAGGSRRLSTGRMCRRLDRLVSLGS
jgi:hypothetical protein